MACWLFPLFLGETFSHVIRSPYYVMPEVLHKHYGPEADLILQGKLDFESEPWRGISNSAKDLIRKMLDKNPKRRLSAHEVLCKFPSPLQRKMICWNFVGNGHQWIVDDRVAPDKPLDSIVLSRLKHFSAMNKLKKMALRVVLRSTAKSICHPHIRDSHLP
ncbi:hypothetical protein HYC85_004807 [Camellia sinensis]|uniref:Protein kinase domain-containing protein n=1 Tax=Camellia sinensis TaxID=4442 RepID=A0A7J7HXJ6_CAMSI|nr:hypothetical protein HYC85_004807 [Camellia sinensis]